MITNADLLSFECRNNFSARSQPAIIKDLINSTLKMFVAIQEIALDK
jgi:hypothetical protein